MTTMSKMMKREPKKPTVMKLVDAFSILEDQHHEINKLFASFEAMGQKAFLRKSKIVSEIVDKLNRHLRLEEEFLYPRVKDLDEEMVLESYEEHDLVKQMIEKIEHTDANDPIYQARVIVLKELVEHHVGEEENDFFPKLRKKLRKTEKEELAADLGNSLHLTRVLKM